MADEPGLRIQLREAHRERIAAKEAHIYWTKQCLRLEEQLSTRRRD